MISEIGRRIERLLYLGFLLILLCFVEVYFSSAAKHFKDTPASTAGYYIDVIASRSNELNRAFEISTRPKRVNSARGSHREILEIREALGLPPVVVQEKASDGKTYQELLTEVFTSHQGEREARQDLAKLFTAERSPAEIVADLKKLEAEEQKKPALIWGIETPRLFSLQYGGTDYRIPANFLCLAFFTALSPIVLAWLGSFYVTRQRELAIIRELSDYRYTFPHILNVFPVTFEKLARQLGLHQTRKSLYHNRKIGGVVTGFFRCLVVLQFVVPMFVCTLYSLSNLHEVFSDARTWIFLSGGILVVVYFVLSLQILMQEIVMFYKKDFYA